MQCILKLRITKYFMRIYLAPRENSEVEVVLLLCVLLLQLNIFTPNYTTINSRSYKVEQFPILELFQVHKTFQNLVPQEIIYKRTSKYSELIPWKPLGMSGSNCNLQMKVKEAAIGTLLTRYLKHNRVHNIFSCPRITPHDCFG